MKIGLIGYFDSGAFSDDMIGYATKKLFLDIEPNLEIKTNLMFHPNVTADFLNQYDLIILCGGSMLGKCEFSPLNSIEQWHDKLSASLCIFGTGYRYEPDKEPLSEVRRRRTELLFDVANIIFLRGERSIYWCEKNGISTSKIAGVGEPLLGINFEKPSSRAVIGGNVRDMPENEIQFTTNEYVQCSMAEIYDFLIENTGMPIEFYSFRHNLYNDNDVVGGVNTIRRMKHKSESRIKVFNTSYDTFRNIDTSFWFGQRLHPSVYAASIGLPFVGLDTQFEKEWDFMTSINSGNFIKVTDGLASFISQYEKVVNGNYMEHVNAEVEKARERIRRIAKEMLETAR